MNQSTLHNDLDILRNFIALNSKYLDAYHNISVNSDRIFLKHFFKELLDAKIDFKKNLDREISALKNSQKDIPDNKERFHLSCLNSLPELTHNEIITHCIEIEECLYTAYKKKIVEIENKRIRQIIKKHIQQLKSTISYMKISGWDKIVV